MSGSDTAATAAATQPHVSFLTEAEAFLAKWLPFLVTGAEVAATATGNPEVDPLIAEAGGAAEATVKAAQSAQNGDLAAAMSSVASAVSQAKQVAGIPVVPVPPSAS
jgi:hypothetical protein